jgi:hypothetical protein
MSGHRRHATALSLGVLMLFGLGLSNATARTTSDPITYPLVANSVAGKQVVNGSLGVVELDAYTRGLLEKDDNTPDVFGTGKIVAQVAPTTVVNIGGKFVEKATVLGQFPLPKGTWLVSTSAAWNRTVAGAAGTRPQIALRYPNGGDAGTLTGTDISPTAGRDLTLSGTKVVILTEDTHVTIWAHGYNDDQSAAGSGELTAAVEVSAVRLG